MKYSPIAIVLVLLAASVGYARTVSDKVIAEALQIALDRRDHQHRPDTVQVSSVVITNKGACIEYQTQNEAGAMHEGFAVYKEDTNVVFLDNSWIWEKTCVTGRYQQRREGKDATRAVSAALKPQPPAAVAMALPVRPGPAAQPLVRVATVPLSSTPPPVVTAPVNGEAPATAQVAVPAAHATVPAPGATATIPGATPVAQPVAAAAQVTVNVRAAPNLVAGTSPKPVETPSVEHPAPMTQAAVPEGLSSATVVVVAEAPVPAPPITTASLVPRPPVSPAQVVQPARVQSAASPLIRVSTAAVPAETGTIRGVTIIDNNGALGEPTAGLVSAAAGPQESLADAARRLRKAKLQ